MTTIEEVTIGAFSQPLVGMSFIISVLGSWVGLTCASRALRPGAGSTSWLWLFGAATSIGGGAIWSMHFIGMLAFDSHVAYALDIGTTLISLAVAIVAAMVGMLIATAMRGKTGYVVGGLVTGAGVGAMHYTGMYAMDMSAKMVWKPAIVVISIVIALAASALALFFAFNVTSRLMRVAAAFIMGIGVCVMHYTGMLALEIHSSPDDKFGHVSGADPVYLAMPIFAISAGMLIVIGFGTMFAGINDDLDDPWTPDQRRMSDSGAHAMPQLPGMGRSPFAGQPGQLGHSGHSGQHGQLSQSGQHGQFGQQPDPHQPLQPLPTRQPAASGSPQANQPAGEGIGGMFAQRPTQLRPQNGRWTPRPYAQQPSNGSPANGASERQPDFFRPQARRPAEELGNEPPAQQPRPQRPPGWLPPRNNNL
ncbi:MHYT domain-containing protein [Nocardioides luteus]|uniref:MHYT domain-containing protein n=1 Tax=Nocardioides luteus TaxID=1844 RepID=UPI0018C95566|nr:MHYT domain-containing protein [Nocardioides luteus]MBG6095674.1 NO-binding membrane sensor protein with MHYT domain [Nocardioides luteus]